MFTLERFENSDTGSKYGAFKGGDAHAAHSPIGKVVSSHGRDGRAARPPEKVISPESSDPVEPPYRPDEVDALEHEERAEPGPIREADEKLTRLTTSVISLESALQELPLYEVRNAQEWARQWVPKAIVVCDALEASLAGPETPEEGLVMRGELSAHVLRDLPWESLGDILGLDPKHPSLLELSSKIREFVEIVDSSDTGQDLSEEVDILASYDPRSKPFVNCANS